MKNLSTAIDRDEASYDYMVNLAQVEKNKRREKFQRKQSEHKAKRNKGKISRDSRRFADALDEYDEY